MKMSDGEVTPTETFRVMNSRKRKAWSVYFSRDVEQVNLNFRQAGATGRFGGWVYNTIGVDKFYRMLKGMYLYHESQATKKTKKPVLIILNGKKFSFPHKAFEGFYTDCIDYWRERLYSTYEEKYPAFTENMISKW